MSEQIIVGIIAAVSALLGVFISQQYELRIRKKDLYFRLWEKVLDRRIQSHEQITQLAKSLRQMHLLGYDEENGEVIRTPVILTSMEEFEKWFSYFSQTIALSSTWLSIEVTRELNLFQDYVINLYRYINQINPDALPKLGNILRDDFIQFSNRIEKLSFEFFSQDLSKLQLNDLRKWHKYRIEETQEKLMTTILFSKSKELEVLLSNNQHGNLSSVNEVGTRGRQDVQVSSESKIGNITQQQQ